MLEPNKQYKVNVEFAEFTKSAEKGTPGIHLKLATGDGDVIHHTCWATENRMKMFRKEMKSLGIDSDVLGAREFWKTPGVFLQGQECSITTKLDYSRDPEGKLVVQWINPVAPEVTESDIDRLAAMFAAPAAGDEDGR